MAMVATHSQAAGEAAHDPHQFPFADVPGQDFQVGELLGNLSLDTSGRSPEKQGQERHDHADRHGDL